MDTTFLLNLLVIGAELALFGLVFAILTVPLRLAENRLTARRAAKPMQAAAHAVRLLRRVILVAFLVGCTVIIGFDAWKMFQGVELSAETERLFRTIPADFWQTILVNSGIVVVALFAARTLIILTDRGLDKLLALALDYKGIRANDDAIRLFFDRLSRMQATLIAVLSLYFALTLIDAPSVLSDYLMIGLKVYLVISLSLLIVSAIAVIVDSLDAISKRYADARGLMLFYNRLRHLIPVLRRSLEYIIYVAVATLVSTQLEFISQFARYGPGIIQGIGVIFLSRMVIEVLNLLIDRAYLHDRLSEEERQHNLTIFPIVKSVLAALVYFLAVVVIMKGLGFDPIPLLAGAGILSVIVGFGAQSLVNDVVSGFFIILDNTFQVGDFVEIKGAKGHVETIGLRTTCIRSLDGEVHILQNGKLGDVINHSRDYTNAVINVGVAHTSNLNTVYAILRDVGQRLNDEVDSVLQPTEVAGIEDFSGPEIVIRTVTRVRPGCHAAVERELRQRIIEAFDKHGIVIPFEARYKFA